MWKSPTAPKAGRSTAKIGGEASIVLPGVGNRSPASHLSDGQLGDQVARERALAVFQLGRDQTADSAGRASTRP